MKEKGAISPTYIDYVMLGIIQEKPISGYGILQSFDSIVPGNFKSSPGTIYPALKRLERFGLVQSREQENSTKKAFHLSSRGQVFLIAWLLGPVQLEDIKKRREELLLRFVFMDDLISQNEKIVFLSSFRDQVKHYITELKALAKRKSSENALHKVLGITHEIESYKASLRWCKKSLREMNA